SRSTTPSPPRGRTRKRCRPKMPSSACASWSARPSIPAFTRRSRRSSRGVRHSCSWTTSSGDVSPLVLVLVVAGGLLGIGLLAVLAWLLSTSYLNFVERRLARRKGLYRELVAELAARERALLEPEIRRLATLLDLEALEAVL